MDQVRKCVSRAILDALEAGRVEEVDDELFEACAAQVAQEDVSSSWGYKLIDILGEAQSGSNQGMRGKGLLTETQFVFPANTWDLSRRWIGQDPTYQLWVRQRHPLAAARRTKLHISCAKPEKSSHAQAHFNVLGSEVVIGSDLAYDEDALPALAALLKALLQPQGSATHALLACMRRKETTIGMDYVRTTFGLRSDYVGLQAALEAALASHSLSWSTPQLPEEAWISAKDWARHGCDAASCGAERVCLLKIQARRLIRV
ncbi:METTL21B [Symbiodinium microadriaticum]|nr:METTL21B [Symbiodinium microadriaticum]